MMQRAGRNAQQGSQGNAMAELLGVRAAAAALGLNASTVSRYLPLHPEVNCGANGKPLVDLGSCARTVPSTSTRRPRACAGPPG